MITTAVIAFFAILLSYFLFFYKLQNDFKKERLTMDDSMPIMDEVKPDKMGKFNIFIPEADREAWEKLPRNEKRKRAQYQQKLIQKGELVEHKVDGKVVGLLKRKDAIEKGII